VTEVEPARQLALAGFAPALARTNRRRPSGQARRGIEAEADALLSAYLRRLVARGAAARGIAVYRYQIRATLRAASRLSGHAVKPAGLFANADLLGRALVDEYSTTGTRLSKWTLAQRRSAIRSFAALMRPELLSLLGEEPVAVVDRGLRAVAERVGGGYRLTGGRPRRRGGFAPPPEDVERVLAAVRSAPGFVGLRNRAFFRLLAGTGCRVNALRLLDGSDCAVMPNGRLRLYLHEKGKAERREVELGAGAAADLRAYLDAFNRFAAGRRLRTRLRIGEPGPIWRSEAGRRWGYPGILASLRAGCGRAGVPAFTPHALRRAFATEAASRLPRHVVAQAGGWQGRDRLDDHYIRPRDTVIREKLGRRADGHAEKGLGLERADAAAVPV